MERVSREHFAVSIIVQINPQLLDHTTFIFDPFNGFYKNGLKTASSLS